ncbi:prolyl oligopeptidase family protein [Citrus sinensis]|nr:prolyl oligopeptidase family protein [Citrus sinensis]
MSSHRQRLSPPEAKKVPFLMEIFGDKRLDNYHWLRDAGRDPDVQRYLELENKYAESIMSETNGYEFALFNELKARFKEDDISVPVRVGSHYYYQRRYLSKDYVQYCRRFIPNNEAPPSVYDIMPTGPDDPPEEVIIDEEVIKYKNSLENYRITAFKVSPNNKLVAFRENCGTVCVIDSETGAPAEKPIQGCLEFEWAGDEAFLYTRRNAIAEPQVWFHKLGEEQSKDTCLYRTREDLFDLTLEASESKKFLFVKSKTKVTGFVYYFDVSRPETLWFLPPWHLGIDMFVSHRGNQFFIRRSDGGFHSDVLTCPVDNTFETTVLIPHRERVRVEEVRLFADHIAVYELEEGLPKITTYCLPPVGEPLKTLQGGRTVDIFKSELCISRIHGIRDSQFSSSILRICFYTMRMPFSAYDYDMNTGISVLKKKETILGGFDESNYVTESKRAYASDGEEIPISIVYRKNRVKLDGSDPLLLFGYGSYGLGPSSYSNSIASRLTILDRGIIFAIAHVRGGDEKGKQWHENGKLLNKRNTFTDFIACADYLIKSNYCSEDNLCIEGGSAGGMLIGAVLNMRPELFKVAVADVPSVDVLTTILFYPRKRDLEEWGDPRMEQFYFYIKSYSPVDNVKAQNYPNILVRTAYQDKLVPFYGPAKFVAKLRDMKTDDNLLLLKCRSDGGHRQMPGSVGRLRQQQQDAFKYTFILKALNMIHAPGSEQSRN